MIIFRKVIAFVMIQLIMLGYIWHFSIISYYQLNKAQITEEHCVNKDKPALNCHGKCYLNTLLKTSDKVSSESDYVPTSNWMLVFQSYEILDFPIEPEIRDQFNTVIPYSFKIKTGIIPLQYPPPKLLM